MKKFTVAIIALLCFNKISVAQFNSRNAVTYKELGFGICKTDFIGETQVTVKSIQSDTSTIPISQSANYKLISQTDKIPAKLGSNFGVEFILESRANQFVPLEQVWIFPSETTDEKGNTYKEVRYNISKPSSEKMYSAFTLDHDYFLVKGEMDISDVL